MQGSCEYAYTLHAFAYFDAYLAVSFFSGLVTGTGGSLRDKGL